MIYHKSQYYVERYRIPFEDKDGNQWKVSIQEASFDGQPTVLTGGEIPVEWSGNGDESQDEIILGSTGKIRIVCVDDNQKALFTRSNILPTVINDRRVQVLRYMNNDWVVYWQGFIKPEELTQDWDRTPYEIELPIVSTIAAMEFFPMPLPTDNSYDYFQEQTNIAGLLRAIFAWSGCKVMNLLTNKPIYEDFNGQPQTIPGSEEFVHWTQGVISPSYFYDYDSGNIQPKTFKDVLETICYPYGKIAEYNLDVAFLMRWKNDANDGTRLYSINVWDDYENDVYGTTVRFVDYTSIKKVNLTDILTAGNDNKFSIIMSPSSVKFSSSTNSDSEIFELSEKFIKSSLPIGNTYPPMMRGGSLWSGLNRFIYPIENSYINLECAEDWEFYSDQTPDLSGYSFCRVIEVTADSTNYTFSKTKTVPLGLCFNLNRITTVGQLIHAHTKFTIPKGVITRWGANYIMMTVKPYVIYEKDPSMGNGNDGMFFCIKDLTTSRYYNYNGQNWVNSETWIQGTSFHHSTDGYILSFNEDRSQNDNSAHKLRIGVRVRIASRNIDFGDWDYARMYCSIKLEYHDFDFLVEDSGSWTYPKDAVLSEFANGIANNAEIRSANGGDGSLSIDLKTRAGNKNIATSGIVALPFNSFCDATKYIDTADREMIEIEAAQFKQYFYLQYFDMVTQYAVVKDGSKVYIPVAIGMDPRNDTVKLRLISTNVTS